MVEEERGEEEKGQSDPKRRKLQIEEESWEQRRGDLVEGRKRREGMNRREKAKKLNIQMWCGRG
jgi:hypothetical protein